MNTLYQKLEAGAGSSAKKRIFSAQELLLFHGYFPVRE
jgi:hypothetical protein